MDTSAAPTGVAAGVPVGRWTIDPGNSMAEFAVRNFGVHTVRGIVPIREATVVVAESDRISTVHARLHLAGIDTANAKRDRDLRGHRLLDTEQFPDLTFTATDVRAATEDGWLLIGSMTARGTTIPITLDATLTVGPKNGQFTVRATTRFDRRDLGIRAPRLMIGREVLVQIDAQFRAQ